MTHDERLQYPLLVDLYELTMVDVYRRTGMAQNAATFSLFIRKLPQHRNYFVAAGLDDVLSRLAEPVAIHGISAGRG